MNKDNILSVKLIKKERSSIVKVSYFYPELNRNRDEEITDIPHKDFYQSIKKLSLFLATVFHSDQNDLFTATGFKRMKESTIMITGYTIADNDRVVGISSPQINLDNDSFGFEEDLSAAIDDISLETLMLLNGSKLGVQQITIFDAIEAKKKEDVEKGERSLFEEHIEREELDTEEQIDNLNDIDEEETYHESIDEAPSSDEFITELPDEDK